MVPSLQESWFRVYRSGQEKQPGPKSLQGATRLSTQQSEREQRESQIVQPTGVSHGLWSISLIPLASVFVNLAVVEHRN